METFYPKFPQVMFICRIFQEESQTTSHRITDKFCDHSFTENILNQRYFRTDYKKIHLK